MTKQTYYEVFSEEKFLPELGSYVAYGLRAFRSEGQKTEVLGEVSDLTTDAVAARRLAQICTRCRLDPVHLEEIAEDFLADEDWFYAARTPNDDPDF